MQTQIDNPSRIVTVELEDGVGQGSVVCSTVKLSGQRGKEEVLFVPIVPGKRLFVQFLTESLLIHWPVSILACKEVWDLTKNRNLEDELKHERGDLIDYVNRYPDRLADVRRWRGARRPTSLTQAVKMGC